MDVMRWYYTMGEAAQFFGVSRQSIWRWCYDGKLKTVQLPSGRRVILRDEVDRVMNAGSQEGELDGEEAKALSDI